MSTPPNPLEVVTQIISSYKPYAIGAVVIAVIWLFVLAKIKKEVRIRKYQRQENERAEARQRNREQREKQQDRIKKQENRVR
ncbi:hypothetical protein H8K47_10600 [Undibacterium sp. CY7W]|uniref:Uncharacterized protein n=1 Tax=Undibacterium rugosum TaxID=2762291 RepID=A0A923KT98_9BURK|nr:hypothetical protein [Undibacterium rugosum]MBC3935809.1 hypothetical protein [Undibacterium rugosum]